MKAFVFLIVLMFLPLISQAEPTWHPLPKDAYRLSEVYPEAQKLVFAVEYARTLSFERLLHERLSNERGRSSDPAQFEDQLLSEIKFLINNPPNTKVDVSNIAYDFSFRFPLVVNLVNWSNLLNQFVLDVRTTSSKGSADSSRKVGDLLDFYKQNQAIAISDSCTIMEFLESQAYSGSVEVKYPRLHQFLWISHLYYADLHEALMQSSRARRSDAVAGALAKLRKAVAVIAGERTQQPTSYANGAPLFSRHFPAVAAVLENSMKLQSLMMDLLVSEQVQNADLRSEGHRLGRVLQDSELSQNWSCK